VNITMAPTTAINSEWRTTEGIFVSGRTKVERMQG
jgi:hypothetical protein